MVSAMNTLLTLLLAITTVAFLATSYLIFFHAPVELTMGIVQKIFYFHVPAAMAMYGGFVMTSVVSMIYLLKPRRALDNAAVIGVETGLLFGLFVLYSGPLWAYKAWGKPWVWDPQLTATVVLFLLYGGYWLLRLFGGASQQIRMISAVLAVVASVTIPFVHFAVRVWGGIHPTVEREGGDGLGAEIATTFGVSMLTMLLLFVCLVWMQLNVARRQERVNQLYVEVEDLLRSHT